VHKGPFLRFGNTFFDPESLPIDAMDPDRLHSLDYSTASRVFLKYRMENDFSIFDLAPEYLRAHTNGIVWHNLILIYSFSMSHDKIVRLYRYFEDDVVVKKDEFISYYMYKLMTESQIYNCVRIGVDAFSVLGEDISHHEIACIYSMILEDDVGYDKRLSRIIRAQSELSKIDFLGFLRETMDVKIREFPGHELRAFHNGVPVDLLDMFGKLLEGLAKQSFYEKIYYEKVLIEAFTGVDLSGFYERSTLMPQRASLRLEQAADEIDFDRFEAGRRYFFGRPLPD
jgi:hypothetical protein